MTAPTPEALEEAVRHAVGIADQLAGDWALIMFDATHPRRPDPDRPTRAVPRPPAGQPDYVKADRDDPGIGDHTARKALAVSAGHIQTAQRLTRQAVALHHGTQAAPVARRPLREAVDVRTAVGEAVRGLQRLLDGDVTHSADTARSTTHAAASALLQAQAALRTVLRDYDHVGEPTAERRCWNCGRDARPGGTECAACNRYRLRSEAAIKAGRKVTHRLRPVPRYEDAHRARQRRQERLKPGQLDIEGPAPSGRYVDGEWEQATPHPTQDRSREAS